jgi:hypothetical protein
VKTTQPRHRELPKKGHGRQTCDTHIQQVKKGRKEVQTDQLEPQR